MTPVLFTPGTLTLTLTLTLTPTLTLKVRTALVDMLNLARTRRILGSGYSSFSEAARFYGSTHSLLFDRAAPAGDSGWEWFHSLPEFETAGVDFGEAVSVVSNETRLLAKGNLRRV